MSTMHELIAKCVTKTDSQDVCFNGYPITDTTDQWSPIFEYQHVYIIFPPNCTSYDHVMPKCALCTPQVHHMDCRIALPTTTWCQKKVLYVHHRCTTWSVGLYTTGSYDHVVPKSALCTPQVHRCTTWKTCSMYTTGVGLHFLQPSSYDHVVPKSALCTPQVHHMDCRIALPTTTWCQKVLYVHHRCTTWTVGLHFLRPRGAKMCSMYTTGAPHGL